MRTYPEPASMLATIRRQALLCLLLLALLLRAAIPSGFMPAADASALILTLCTASGPVLSTVKRIPTDADPHQQSAHDTCVYSTLAAATVLPGAMHAPASPAPWLRVAAPAPSRPVLPAQVERGPPLGSRAPPPSVTA